jgi:hypothetical protein
MLESPVLFEDATIPGVHDMPKAVLPMELLRTEVFVSSVISQRSFPKSGRATVSRTVQELNVFIPLGIGLSEKQIPRFIGNVSS